MSHLYVIMIIRLSFQVLLVFNYKYIYSTDGIINLHITHIIEILGNRQNIFSQKSQLH